MFLHTLAALALGCFASQEPAVPSGRTESPAAAAVKQDTAVARLTLPPKWRRDGALLRACDALETALGPEASGTPARRYVVVQDGQAPDLELDGFAFVSAGGGTPVVVRVHGIRGACYALQELARRVRLSQWSPGEPIELLRNPAFTDRLCSMHDNPGEPRFDTQFRDPKVLLDLGFNGMIVHGLAGLCTYDDYDARLYPKDAPERATVLADRKRIKRVVSEAKRNHLMVFLNGDELCVPHTALDLYGDAILATNAAPGRFLLSPSKPKVHELVRATFEELMKLFPEVDGFQVRTGEVYTQSEPTLFGHMPTKGIDDTCKDWSKELKLKALVDTITKVVCDEHGKRFNLRMWGYYDSVHSDPAKWTAFASALEPNPLRTFSFKHAKTDHWRWNVLNPNFGVGEHAQWAEFQMAREYEGKGAYPSYLGRYLAQGATEIAPTGGLATLREKGVRGAWCWARGGGWNGPFPASEDWIALNVHAFARLLWDPNDDPWELARQWSVLNLGLEPNSLAAERFVRVQKLSEEALLESRYIGAFIRKGHLKGGSGWTPDGNWTRDDDLGVRDPKLPAGEGLPPAKMFYDFLAADGTVAEAVAERERAIELWKELVREFELLVKDTGDAQHVQELFHTALYGQRVFDTASHGFLAGWNAYAWADGGKKDAKLAAKAREHLVAARAAWKDCSERVFKLPGVATPYREFGFTKEWDAIEALLEGRASFAPTTPPTPATVERRRGDG
ncbi:MAG: hypothetical protein HZA53_16645 [Planctomycetes bacterium]|nr:hypothetical protein [Planctomycetota bacterium]